MFSIVLNIVGTLLHLYVAHGLLRIDAVRQRVSKRGWWLGALLVWLIYIAGVHLGDDALDWRWWPGQFALMWLGITFILAQYLLLADLLTGFGLWWRRFASRIRSGAAIAGVVVCGFAIVQAMRAPAIIEYQIVLPDLPPERDGTVIVALSDLHLGAQRRANWLAARVQQINALAPDAVLLLGDLVEDEPLHDAQLPVVLRGLQAPLGVWAVTGNHEYYGAVQATMREFGAGGVRWLRNETVTLAPGLNLLGLDDIGRSRKSGADVTLGLRASATPKRAGATLLMAHIPAPALVERASALGISLMLSGHTHGGQIWPFDYLVRRQFPQLVGLHQQGNMQLLISRGAGSWGPRMRLWQRGEILRLTLRSPHE